MAERPLGLAEELGLGRRPALGIDQGVAQVGQRPPGFRRQPLAQGRGDAPGFHYVGEARAEDRLARQRFLGERRRGEVGRAHRVPLLQQRADGARRRRPLLAAGVGGDRLGEHAEMGLDEADHRLRPLQVAPEPEQVVGRPRRQVAGDAADARGAGVQEGRRVDRRVGQDPDIRRADAGAHLGRVGAVALGDAAEGARQHPPALRRGGGEDAHDEGPGHQAPVLPSGHGRERRGLLRHPVERALAQGGHGAGAGGVEDGAGEHRVALGAAQRGRRGAQRQAVEIGERVGQTLGIAAPPRPGAGEPQLLAGEAPGDGRQVGPERGRFEHAGTRHVADHRPAPTQHLEDAGHAEARIRAQLHRVEVVGIDPPPHRVGALEPGDGAHVQEPVAHHEVVALDQEEAEIAGERGLLDIGAAVGARREQADARVAALARRGEAGAEGLEEAGQALDVEVGEQVREGAGEHHPVLQRVAEAGGRLRAVGQDLPAPVRPAADIRGIDRQPAPAGRRDAVDGPQEFGMPGHHPRGQKAFRDEPAGAVDVGDDALHQAGALDDAGRQLRPVGGVDDEGQRSERPGMLAPVAVDPVGDARVADMPLGGEEAGGDLPVVEPGEAFEEARPAAAQSPVRIHQRVGEAGPGRVRFRPAAHARGRILGRRVRVGPGGPVREGGRSGHRGAGVRRSRVSGKSPVRSSAGIATRPGVWPMASNRARRRPSAS
ncbi:hypothetical protein CHKEEEPN_3484 [Methylorubrum podarium]|nr:hypothetical protein CHKEEEPN_3484 [Methylorubrum podarium]